MCGFRLLLQRFILDMVEWHLDPDMPNNLPSFKVYTNAGRYQRMSPYVHESAERPLLPVMPGTFIIIRLHQGGIDPGIISYKMRYLVMTARPPPVQDVVYHEKGELSITHDDVIKWTHFSRYWPFVQGIHRWPVNSPHKGQWRGALVFYLVCASVNNRSTGDLRCHYAHYDVIVMWVFIFSHPTLSSASGKATLTQNGRYVVDDIYKIIFLFENCCIL